MATGTINIPSFPYFDIKSTSTNASTTNFVISNAQSGDNIAIIYFDSKGRCAMINKAANVNWSVTVLSGSLTPTVSLSSATLPVGTWVRGGFICCAAAVDHISITTS